MTLPCVARYESAAENSSPRIRRRPVSRSPRLNVFDKRRDGDVDAWVTMGNGILARDMARRHGQKVVWPRWPWKVTALVTLCGWSRWSWRRSVSR